MWLPGSVYHVPLLQCRRGCARPLTLRRLGGGINALRPPTGVEGAQVERLIVQRGLRLLVGGQEYLEAAVQQEAAHLVRAHAAPHPIRGLEQREPHAGPVQVPRAAQPRNACMRTRNMCLLASTHVHAVPGRARRCMARPRLHG